MQFTITFHPTVKDDIATIDKTIRERLRAAIESRFANKPALYGKPLRGTLAGYWKLRVGDWRVVYAIRENVILVLAIKHRSRIYGEIEDRR